MDNTRISKLFLDAAKLLRADFEFARSSNPLSAEKGAEVEDVLKSFLNSHLPKRFRADSGILIDDENNVSKQTDVIIYDTLCSPLYRHSKRTLIIPINTVACIIEVKTCLDKNEMKDSYRKIASCKQLKKRPLSSLDRASTTTGYPTIGTLGVIFGFRSKTSLKTLANNLVELNKSYQSRLWPDMVVVLDEGVIYYGVQIPGDEFVAGALYTPTDDSTVSPPFYVHLLVHKDGELALNRFFCRVLDHLTFYPWRPCAAPWNAIMEGGPKQARGVETYQYNTKHQLNPVLPKMYQENISELPLSMTVSDKNGKVIGVMQFIPWQSGAIVRWRSRIPLPEVLNLLVPKPKRFKVEAVAVSHSGTQLSGVLSITERDFLKWPGILAKKTNMKGSLQEPNNRKKKKQMFNPK